ncbi:cytochrome c oxidase assembly protein COX16 homolog, mitochondrial [Phlebotomus argentipes]|uniref:cytochrome c oxidase assembly protein COX16 homolog, mitochondrial n=1 Tax=Phlebotomus argentipes TaxID=94469 RepID=UPI002892A5D2|nr:cytochrome c oxidase assembly protein COX16 homolog, mitochondrial [Phlebotomus argentipes]
MGKAWYQQKFFKYGAPFIILVTGGSFALREFTSLRYQFAKNTQITPEEMKKHGIEMKKPGEVTLESEYEKIKKLDIDNWENKRGPRPWEQNIPQRPQQKS